MVKIKSLHDTPIHIDNVHQQTFNFRTLEQKPRALDWNVDNCKQIYYSF